VEVAYDDGTRRGLFGLATLPNCLAWLALVQPPTLGSAARSG